MNKMKEIVDDINEAIYKKLDKSERKWVGDSLDEEDIIYLAKNKFGFICVKNDKYLNGMTCSNVQEEYIPRCCYCVMAVAKEKRHTGLSVELIKRCFRWFIRSSYEQMIWVADDDNVVSNRFAKKVGFSYCWKHADRKANVYIMTNPKIMFRLMHKKGD